MPLFKATVVECSHCKKTYKEDELPNDIKEALTRQDAGDPVKRPIWHGCGCLLFIVFPLVLGLLTTVIGLFAGGDDSEGDIPQDIREEYLEQDIAMVTSNPTFESDSISYFIKTCVASHIEGIDTDRIEYLSKTNNNKLLVILKVGDMKGVKKTSRKELVFAVEECIEYALDDSTITDFYIGVDGNWNMLMVKTPYEADLSGKFADKDLLLPFYDDIEGEGDVIGIEEVESDSVVIENIDNRE